jgi:hypothetical protein
VTVGFVDVENCHVKQDGAAEAQQRVPGPHDDGLVAYSAQLVQNVERQSGNPPTQQSMYVPVVIHCALTL